MVVVVVEMDVVVLVTLVVVEPIEVVVLETVVLETVVLETVAEVDVPVVVVVVVVSDVVVVHNGLRYSKPSSRTMKAPVAVMIRTSPTPTDFPGCTLIVSCVLLCSMMPASVPPSKTRATRKAPPNRLVPSITTMLPI
jgi:hypothetical protein